MYVTRVLSHCKKFPEPLRSPPEGPNSGYLVLQDKESETYSCFGLSKNRSVNELPFPQNKKLTISSSDHELFADVLFIPVLNQPLSVNLYYAILSHGKHKGKAFTSSREEDMVTSCCSRSVQDVKPRPLDPCDLYQQFEIVAYEGKSNGFTAKSMAYDGFPPLLLREKCWIVRAETPKHYRLGEAPGINALLREVLPDIDFLISCKMSEPIVVGKWYCPFVLDCELK